MNRKAVIYGLAVVIGMGVAYVTSYASDRHQIARVETAAIGPGGGCAMQEGACGMKEAGGGCGMQAGGGCGMHGAVATGAESAALASEGACPLHNRVAAGEGAQCAEGCAGAHQCTDACRDKAKDEGPKTDTGTDRPARPDTNLTT